MKGAVLAGTASGVGKTVATLAVARALERAGYEPQLAKAGPDFIDPSHHEALTGTPSRTLDPWMQSEDGLRRNVARGEGDVCVVEGVMGMYDGDASTARVAEVLDLPVILVVNAAAGMESVAASALGFREYAAYRGIDVEVVGVLAQRAHGGRHADGIRNALPEDMAWFGRIPPDDDLEIPERHLGLHLGSESPVPANALARAAEYVDVDRLLAHVEEPAQPRTREPDPERTNLTVAIAEDAAFAFRYPATIERLCERATVELFSPVAGEDLPDCDGVYLPGGYPELHAETLANAPALETIADRAADGLPVLGECGGMMALAESLTTVDGNTHEMAGVLPVDVTMHERYQALDHVELAAKRDCPTAGSGEALRGHEFHYSSADAGRDARFAFDVERGEGIDGDRDGIYEYDAMGTYAHVHPASGAFDSFLENL